MLACSFRIETEKITEQSLKDIGTLADWKASRPQRQQQLQEMLGLSPLPPKTPLNPVITGHVDRDTFFVEKLHFQSQPGLYVTASFYLPKQQDGPLPAVLYLCGHGRVKKNGISYGNKVHYQHHGAWFARNGYACLTIDTLQLGEIEGLHHGTYSHGQWWWNARGYTPAGVEAWNSIRAVDYLLSRDEVDAERIGVTGRSGGGASTWWIAALDDRIKVAVPVAGITSLRNHVVDGCVEGHCDCMYPVNTYQWDFSDVAALAAPRPLLISNSDKDRIFPLDGVFHIHQATHRIYELSGHTGQLGLQITEGPHRDTQELRIHAFHWFNRFLRRDERYARGSQPLISMTATPFFRPEELRVFEKLPADQRNTTIHETFVPQAPPPPVPENQAAWHRLRDRWMTALQEKCFRGWPEETPPLHPEQILAAHREGIRLTAYDFTPQEPWRLRLYLVRSDSVPAADIRSTVLHVLNQDDWETLMAALRTAFAPELTDTGITETNPAAFAQLRRRLSETDRNSVLIFVCPRGIGPTEWTRDHRKRTHIRRRFMLLGQTRDGMRVFDVIRAAEAVRKLPGLQKTRLHLTARDDSAGISLYASLFIPQIDHLDLKNLSPSHRQGPVFLNVLRFLDIPQAVAMAAERSPVVLKQNANDSTSPWTYASAVADRLNWPDGRLTIQQQER